MLDRELRERAQEWAERTAVQAGLPPKVIDTATLRRIAQLFGLDERQRQVR